MVGHRPTNHMRVYDQSFSFGGEPKDIRIEIRDDAMFGLYSSIICPERARREQKPIVRAAEANKKPSCFFEPENIAKTPEPRIYYPQFQRDGFIPLSVPNLFPFALEHRVNCFTSHEKTDPALLDEQDMFAYLFMSRANARGLKAKKYQRMVSMLNFGPLAGGTQQHPHFQDGTLITRGSRNERELKAYKFMEKFRNDPLSYYMNSIRRSELFGYENPHAIVYAPFAPEFPDQLDIMTVPNTSSFLDLEDACAEGIANALHKSISFLTAKRGVTDFNVIAHQSPLGQKSNYRLHFHIYPRNKNLIGGIEAGEEGHVIDIYPEATAKEFRAHLAQNKTVSLAHPQTAA